jgi:hypothetical protein
MESPDVAVYAPTHPCICARRPCLREFTVKSAVVNVPWSAAHHTGQLHNMLTFSATCAFDTPLQRNVRLLSTLHLFPLRSVTRMATVVAAAATVSALVNLVSVTRTWMKIASFLSFVTACHAQNVTRELQLCMACSTPCCVHDRSHPPHVTRELQLYSMLRSRSLTSTTAFASATTCANCAATHTDVCGAVCWTRSCARFCARHMLTTHLSTALPPTFQSSHSRRCVSKGRLRCARPSSSPPRSCAHSRCCWSVLSAVYPDLALLNQHDRS